MLRVGSRLLLANPCLGKTLNVSRILSKTSPPHRFLSTMVLGAHNFAKLEPSKYQHIVHTALDQGVTTLEVGEGEAAEQALLQALTKASSSASNEKITVLKRVGYRTITSKTVTKLDNDTVDDNSSDDPECISKSFLPLDIHVEDLPDTGSSGGRSKASTAVVHNLGKDYLNLALSNSPLTTKALVPNNDSDPDANTIGNIANIQVVPILHNPEVQAALLSGGNTNSTFEERQDRIRDRLATAMVALERQWCQDDASNVSGYGICSNGLSLPASHPLHVAPETILNAAHQASEELSTESDAKLHGLSVIQFPANVLETAGFDVARQLRELCKEAKREDINLELHCLRPLTCYPDAGTGTGHSFVIADYALPASMEKKLTWSHQMTRPPEVYYVALQTAMAHFDADELLQLKANDAEALTTEQRETLDGCKLMQSLLHDVDNGLDDVRSFRAHEEELYSRVIPLIHDTFESYDEDTAHVLQSFFSAYSLAVRYSIAKNTRKLLVHGESESATTAGTIEPGKIPVYPDLPTETRLQEFGLAHVSTQNVFDKIVVGCTEADQVVDDLEIIRRNQ